MCLLVSVKCNGRIKRGRGLTEAAYVDVGAVYHSPLELYLMCAVLILYFSGLFLIYAVFRVLIHQEYSFGEINAKKY